eukprot:CAMPEP_0170607344 /NCGR_PEP_ID=MMETSP0224-20130122/21004_1 /TAXON_ID=285029 /ORGANISM="Togula jolla, Strain CCCM 725" /LENGTH=100 /DNA_ID=CAMNT_0010932503 /DNA_START=302 /DNA_END=601 /DNA_ORIENTATION=-
MNFFHQQYLHSPVPSEDERSSRMRPCKPAGPEAGGWRLDRRMDDEMTLLARGILARPWVHEAVNVAKSFAEEGRAIGRCDCTLMDGVVMAGDLIGMDCVP